MKQSVRRKRSEFSALTGNDFLIRGFAIEKFAENKNRGAGENNSDYNSQPIIAVEITFGIPETQHQQSEKVKSESREVNRNAQ